MGRLAGRTIMITGAAQGIGASYARAAISEGANVAVCDISDPSELVAELGDRAWGQVCDATRAAEVKEFVTKTAERFGRLDGLVNNAAIFASLGEPKSFEQIESEDFAHVMHVNVQSVFECCRAAAPIMRSQGSGSIVNVSSGTVFKGVPGYAHYVASKGAVLALTRVLARELGLSGIRVNTVAPGFTLSEGVLGSETMLDTFRGVAVSTRCLPRDQRPEDLSGAVLFLLSDDSEFMTGQTVVVDGGAVML